MQRYYITGMSHQRKTALEKLGRDTEAIELNIAKCVVYGKECRAYNHWIKEFVTWFMRAGRLHDERGNRFTRQEYKEYLFDGGGTTTSDAESTLHDLKEYIKGKSEYEDFEITQNLIVTVCAAAQSIGNTISEYLAELKKTEQPTAIEIENIIKNELEDARSCYGIY